MMFSGGRPGFSASATAPSSETSAGLRTLLDDERRRHGELQGRFRELEEQYSNLRGSLETAAGEEQEVRNGNSSVDGPGSVRASTFTTLIRSITLMMGEVTSLTRVLGKAISGDGDFDADDLFGEGEEQESRGRAHGGEDGEGAPLSPASIGSLRDEVESVRRQVREARRSLNDALARSLGSGCAFQ